MKVKRPLGRVPAFTSGGMDGGGVAEPRGGVFGLQVTAGRWQVSKVFGCICEDVTDGVKRDHASLSVPPPHILFIYYLIFWGGVVVGCLHTLLVIVARFELQALASEACTGWRSEGEGMDAT